MDPEKRKSKMKRFLRHQLEKDAMPSYIYTYPLKNAYQPYTRGWHEAAGAWRSCSGKIALYIHIPFCRMKCAFCGLLTVTAGQRDSVIERYAQCIGKEIDLMLPFLGKEIQIDSLYFGGGTPTILSLSQIKQILDKIRGNLAFSENAEISIETTPNAIEHDDWAEYLDLGFNRVSIGIQTFMEAGLKRLGRTYGAELGRKAASSAIDSGMPNVNIDLIYGLPGQTPADWMRDLECALDIGPQTITAYPLAIRTETSIGKTFAEHSVEFAANTALYDLYSKAAAKLGAAGYRAETLVTFARDGGGCRHEHNEYSGIPTLSFGVGARNYAPGLHYGTNDHSASKSDKEKMMIYMDSIERGEIPIKSAVPLSKKDRQCRYMILGLLSSGIHHKRYRELFEEDIATRYMDCFEVLRSEGMLIADEDRITLTAKGRKYSSITGDFMAKAFAESGSMMNTRRRPQSLAGTGR